MGKQRHSPAPWSVPHFACPDVDCQCEYVLSEFGGMGAVCAVYASGEGDWKKTGDNPKFEEAVANAYLIAAAPDLLEALQRLVAVFGVTFTDTSKFELEAISKARAALSKATGASQ